MGGEKIIIRPKFASDLEKNPLVSMFVSTFLFLRIYYTLFSMYYKFND